MPEELFRRIIVTSLSLICWVISFGQTIGVVNWTESSGDDYVLFSPLITQDTYLIDKCGRLIHEWESDFIAGNSTYLLDDGRLLRTNKISTGFFQGGGLGGRIQLLDWDGNELWYYEQADTLMHFHHDVEFMPNGNILAIAWEYHSTEEAIANGRNPNFLSDGLWSETILELSPTAPGEAEIVWQWRLWDHLIQQYDPERLNYGLISDHPRKMDLNFVLGGEPGPGDPFADWMHFNTVDYSPERDEIMLSSRNTSEIYIIDHSTTTAEAATDTGGNSGFGGDFLFRFGNPLIYDRGNAEDQVLDGQHDCQWIPTGFENEGDILIFDNRAITSELSRIVRLIPEFDPSGNYLIETEGPFQPTEPDYLFESDFYSPFISGVEPLEDGSMLICSGQEGRFLQYSSSGSPEWEYINPVGVGGPVQQGFTPQQNAVFKLQNVPSDFPGLNGQDLTPGDPLEIDPLPLPCVSNHVEEGEMECRVNGPIQTTIYDLSGRVITIIDGTFSRSQALRSGLYIFEERDALGNTCRSVRNVSLF